jgi:outer membrane murein-binding lipoprotein Lpp
LKGLLGRLDYLIVAESSSPTLSRVRVLDVETGAVKMATFCQARTSLFGGLSTAEPECIPSVVARTSELARSCLALKRQRLMKAAAAERAAAEQSAEQERKRVEREKQQGRITAQRDAEFIEQQKATERQRAEDERANQEMQAEIDRQINAAKSGYEDLIARLSEHTAFWERISGQLRRQGLGLRRDVQSALTSAHMTATRCGEFLANRKPSELSTCVDELNHKVDQLEQYR